MSKETNAALAVGGGAALLAAIALMKTGATPASAATTVGLDEPTTQLLVAIAQGVVDIETAIASLGSGVGGGQGWPPNTEHITALRVPITALNRGHQLPAIDIPDGFQLLMRGWPTNANIIWVAGSELECVNINTAYPLLPNDIVGYGIKNAEAIWVSGGAVGDFVVITVEQRQR